MRLDSASVSDPDVVYFRGAESPVGVGRATRGSARVIRWDGLSGEVQHDGACDLVLRRACYPGWIARLDGGREVPIVPADGGLQSIRLTGSGVTKVEMTYRPTFIWPAAGVSLAAVAAAAAVLTASAARARGAARDPTMRPDGRARSGGPG